MNNQTKPNKTKLHLKLHNGKYKIIASQEDEYCLNYI